MVMYKIDRRGGAGPKIVYSEIIHFLCNSFAWRFFNIFFILKEKRVLGRFFGPLKFQWKITNKIIMKKENTSQESCTRKVQFFTRRFKSYFFIGLTPYIFNSLFRAITDFVSLKTEETQRMQLGLVLINYTIPSKPLSLKKWGGGGGGGSESD